MELNIVQNAEDVPALKGIKSHSQWLDFWKS